jgi:predicted alpha/beta hydrolase
LAVLQEIRVDTSDGVSLAASVFRPEEQSGRKLRAAVMISSASGVPRRFYEYFARFLCDQGITVVTYDYRGIGDSLHDNIKQDKSRLRDWGLKDFPAILNWLSKNLDATHFFAVGHSIGGHLVGMAPNNQLLSAAIAVASQDGYWRNLRFPANLLRFVEWLVIMPVVVRAAGHLPRGLAGEALPRDVALEWAQWCRHPRYFVHHLGAPVEESFKAFNKPYLFYNFSDDRVAPKICCESLIEAYSNAKVERKEIKPADWGVAEIGHFGFFRKSAPQSAWQDISNWIRAQCLVKS